MSFNESDVIRWLLSDPKAVRELVQKIRAKEQSKECLEQSRGTEPLAADVSPVTPTEG